MRKAKDPLPAHKALSRDEEQKLARKLHAKMRSTRDRARNALVESVWPMLWQYAGRAASSLSTLCGITHEEIYSEIVCDVIERTKYYKASKGRFTTFARVIARQSVASMVAASLKGHCFSSCDFALVASDLRGPQEIVDSVELDHWRRKIYDEWLSRIPAEYRPFLEATIQRGETAKAVAAKHGAAESQVNAVKRYGKAMLANVVAEILDSGECPFSFEELVP